MSTRILLIDDQPLPRQGFRFILGSQSDLQVVGEAADGRAAVDLTGRLAPDVLLMDLSHLRPLLQPASSRNGSGRCTRRPLTV